MASSSISTLDALTALCTSIPDWKARLDELNGQIAQRQLELARLTENELPSPSSCRSLKNKGSTESLRPRDNCPETPSRAAEDDEEEAASHGHNGISRSPVDTPQSRQRQQQQQQQKDGLARPRSSAAAHASVSTPPPAGPRRSPTSPTRKFSQPTPTSATTAAPERPRPTVLRKRKPESLASGESLAPKYRTRSMIIVYYDSAVQTAFEELVKFVSGSRNAMRKGKMAAKMAEMRRAAELEIGDGDDDEEEEDNDDDQDGLGSDLLLGHGNTLLVARQSASTTTPVAHLAGGTTPDREGPDVPLPKLNFVSTRQMGPPRGGARPGGSTLSAGMLRGFRRGGDAPDIFDELDKGLEWCQGQCEHAAHQFLREGECSTEVENIKRRLGEVRLAAEKEVERLRRTEEEEEEEAEKPKPKPKPKPKEREREKLAGRKGRAAAAKQQELVVGREPAVLSSRLEVDELEVDDAADDDDDGPPPKLVFKRSRDIGF